MGQAIPFSRADLTANRQGHLSEAQSAYWSRHLHTVYGGWNFLIVALALVLLASLVAGDFGAVMTIFLGVGLVSLAGVTLVLAHHWHEKALWAVTYPNVETVTGTVRGQRRRFKARLVVEGKRYLIAREALAAFHKDEVYTVYYLRGSKRVIAVEAVKGE